MIFSALDSEVTERQCLPSVVDGYHKRKETSSPCVVHPIHYYKQEPKGEVLTWSEVWQGEY